MHLVFLLILIPSCFSDIGGDPKDRSTTEGTSPGQTTTSPGQASTNPGQDNTTVTTKSPPLVDGSGIGDDLNCTYLNSQGILVYSERATGCFNVLDDDKCAMFFGDGKDIGAMAGENNTRSIRCYKDSNGDSSVVKSMALKYCARFCGYCCETEEFNCMNNPTPAINCSQLNKSQCLDPGMKSLLVENCPNICGFCDVNGCVDKEEICTQQPTICDTDKKFSSANCRRQCNLCTPYGTPPPATGIPNCVDRYPACADWNKYNNYCGSYAYTLDDKIRDCPVTCGFC